MSLYIFSQLLETYQLVIPMLQRDYAQGRCDPRSTQVRKEFVAAIKTALADEQACPLDLGLIYGSQHEGRMILLDGQQRATTLYLLHWYLAMRRGGSDLPFENFIYETRITSRDFCRALCDCVGKDKLEYFQHTKDSKADFSAWMDDQPWFFRSWKNDATVSSMVSMLAEIHNQFKDCDAGVCWEKLTNAVSMPIHFQFLDIEQYGMTDEIYIKINARGRPLTEFEKFKAWLEERLKDKAQEWASKMDNEWMDFFWRQQPERNPASAQGNFYKFLKELGVAHLLANLKSHEKGETTDDYKSVLEGVLKDDGGAFVETETLNMLFAHATKPWKYIAGALEILRANDNAIERSLDGVAFFTDTTPLPWSKLLSEGGIDYTQRALLHALCCFFKYRKSDFEHLEEWMRICRNVILNSSYSGYDLLKNTAPSIQSLADKCLSDTQNPLVMLEHIDPNAFHEKSLQLEEEILKARLINEDADWASRIKQIENHDVFRGCIRLLLGKKGANDSDLCARDRFCKRVDATKELLCEINKKSTDPTNEFWLIRATLSKCDPIALQEKQKIVLADTPENWRDLLTGKSEPNTSYQTGFLKLVDEWIDARTSGDKPKISEWLKKQVNGFQFFIDASKEDSRKNIWHAEFIRNGAALLGVLQQTSRRKIQHYGNSQNVYLYKEANAGIGYNFLNAVDSCPDITLFSPNSIAFFKFADHFLADVDKKAVLDNPNQAIRISGGGYNYYKGDRIGMELLAGLYIEFDEADNKEDKLVLYLNGNEPDLSKKSVDSGGIRWELNLKILFEGSFNDPAVRNELLKSLELIPKNTDTYAKLEKLIERWRKEKVCPN